MPSVSGCIRDDEWDEHEIEAVVSMPSVSGCIRDSTRFLGALYRVFVAGFAVDVR